jgi:hypothetical protein
MTGDQTRLLTDPSYDRKNQTLNLHDISMMNHGSQQKRRRKEDRPVSGTKVSLTEPSVDRELKKSGKSSIEMLKPYEDMRPRREKELLFQLNQVQITQGKIVDLNAR